MNREASSELLREAGLEVAEDGATALQLARTYRYDVILLRAEEEAGGPGMT